MIIEEKIEIRTADGMSDGFLYRPDAAGRTPGILHFTDIGGIRFAPQTMARTLAAAGYVVLVPNVFYRTGRPPLFDFPGNRRTPVRRESAPRRAQI